MRSSVATLSPSAEHSERIRCVGHALVREVRRVMTNERTGQAGRCSAANAVQWATQTGGMTRPKMHEWARLGSPHTRGTGPGRCPREPVPSGAGSCQARCAVRIKRTPVTMRNASQTRKPKPGDCEQRHGVRTGPQHHAGVLVISDPSGSPDESGPGSKARGPGPPGTDRDAGPSAGKQRQFFLIRP
jgi:hypothetical protein